MTALATLPRKLHFAVFADSSKDAAQLTGWKTSKQLAIQAYRRSSRRKIDGREVRGQFFVQPAKEEAAT